MKTLGSHRLFYLSLGLIAVVIASVQVGAYYRLQMSDTPAESNTDAIAVNVLFNYGNATVKWHNETGIPANWNFYNLTLYLTRGNVEARFYGPPLIEHFVTGINGVKNQGHSYWTLWIFCQRQNAWTLSPVGADLVRLVNGQTLAWAYEVPYQPPVPGAGRVDSCS